jgi:hypothetical protein
LLFIGYCKNTKNNYGVAEIKEIAKKEGEV